MTDAEFILHPYDQVICFICNNTMVVTENLSLRIPTPNEDKLKEDITEVIDYLRNIIINPGSN